jgi:hypothetical protein
VLVIRSAELSLSVSRSGRSVTAFGQESVRGATVRDVRLTETFPSVGALNLLVKDARYYAQLPPTRFHSDKDWVLLSPDSRYRIVRQVYERVLRARQSASLSAGPTLAAAATRFAFLGTQLLDGVVTAHYLLDVPVARLPAGFADRARLLAGRVSSVRAEIWVDARGHPRLLSEQGTGHADTGYTSVHLRNFDAPVDITPPAADRVATG